MAGNAQSGATLKKTMIKKFGSEEAWKEVMRQNGRIGGSKTGVKKGFAANPELARIAGSKCGRVSKKGYKFIRETETFMEYSDNNKPGEKVKFYKERLGQ